jgi:AbrB family looped-hinge helix DNA binding protein
MATATLTAKGQITLPKRVRERLGVHTGDQVIFVVEEQGVSLYPVPRTALSALRGSVRGRGRGRFTSRAAERAAAQAVAAADALGHPARQSPEG